MRFKPLRQLHLIHRWLGIAIGGFVLAWFFSGVVMMYVGYPKLSDSERHEAMVPLRAEQVRISAARAWQTLLVARKLDASSPESVRLANVQLATSTRPSYLFLTAAQWHSVWADDGSVRDLLEPSEAGPVAQAMRPGKAQSIERIEQDQWTFGALDAYRPLYRVDMDDARGSVLYVSARTGEVVRDTDRWERGWNWVGSVIHWIYFTPLRVLREPWRQVVMWVSGIAFGLAVTGLVLGIQRLRVRRRYSSGRITPYHGWKRWHHMFGLAAATFTLTWLFSGWLSVNPFGLFDRNSNAKADRLTLAGGKLNTHDLAAPITVILQRQTQAVAEVEYTRMAGQGYVWLRGKEPGESQLVAGDTQAPTIFTQAQLVAAATKLRPDATLTEATWLSKGDLYYYRHHDEKPLPVLRVDFDDAPESSFYLDPASGKMAAHANNSSRLYRWLFHAFHRLDFPWLTQYRPVWDVLVISLTLIGLMLTLSGMVLGWRRLRK